MTIYEYMAGSPQLKRMLSELPRHMLDTISIREYAPGEAVMQHCEENADTYIVLKGVCCATCNLINGERSWFRKKTVGDVFGLLGALSHEYDFSSTIFAKTECTLARIPCATVKQCFGRYPVFTQELAGKVINRLNHNLWTLSECNSYPPYAGLVSYLIYAYEFYAKSYAADYEGPVRIHETQAEIAHYVCINVRTLQRVLPLVREEGLVDIRSNRIYIDRAQYERLKQRKAEYFH